MTKHAITANARRLTILQPDDWHLHLRDGDALQAVVAATAQQFARAIIMPNLRPPIRRLADAEQYAARIRAAQDSQSDGARFEPLMTLYLTEQTTVQEITQAHQSGLVKAIKLYPAGATTNSDDGVSDVSKVDAVLDAMQSCGMPLLVHGEVTDAGIDVFDREAVFIDQVLIPLRKKFPALKVVFEHITTLEAVDYVLAASGPIGATITPQHLLYNRNAIFSGGLRPHWYCLPVLKREKHRLALLDAATSGDAKFFLGTDSAPHPAHLKAHAAACAGCYSAPHAMALYATAFDQRNKLDLLEGFASKHGADFYGLPRNTATITLIEHPWTIPESLPFGGNKIVPLAAGQTLNWQVLAD